LRIEKPSAFGVGLHQAVFDAVMDHLGEVAGAGRADAAPALVLAGRQRLEDRPQGFHDLFVTADHHAVALGQAPHAAAGAAVDVVDALSLAPGGVAERILVVGVAAVDHRVALVQQPQQRGDGVVGDLARGHHQPQHARRGQGLYQRLERSGRAAALAFQLLARIGVGVEAGDLVTAIEQPLRHVGAHLAETDHAQLHGSSLV